MIYFNGCVRCGGDAEVHRGPSGEFVYCLRCRWSRDLPSDPPLTTNEDVRTVDDDIPVKWAS